MEIRVGENESLESALKRFKRKCARSGVLAEVRRREHYEKPSVKRKKRPKLLESVNNKRDVLFRDGRRNTLLNCHPDGKYTEIVLKDALRL